MPVCEETPEPEKAQPKCGHPKGGYTECTMSKTSSVQSNMRNVRVTCSSVVKSEGRALRSKNKRRAEDLSNAEGRKRKKRRT